MTIHVDRSGFNPADVDAHYMMNSNYMDMMNHNINRLYYLIFGIIVFVVGVIFGIVTVKR